MQLRRTAGLILALVSMTVLATAVTGCGAEPTPKSQTGERLPPLADQFKRARGQAKSDFERDVWDRAIKTGKIDPADYEETHSRYRRCAEDAGYRETYTRTPAGLYRVDPPVGLDEDKTAFDTYMKATEDCADSSGLMRVEALYNTQISNPDLLADPKALVVQCLKKAGLVQADYTPEKFDAFMKSNFTTGDFDPMHEEAQKCFAGSGMAINAPQGNGNEPGQNPDPVENGK
ncbi:hypothetical protein Val02_53290 [Virgisporangium aliadipatigenens]|uniref:Lipoprotein n=1 Tax=Virgisporangium aliadipatigenens TaxID=741659 RepID=A0A8J3YRI4_9ACTN|nr:hypothetical protein [Virgisporangium aliadipatigenens]GIJ48443.1 hypothetical protein Val02_53290 [Virgisporangium aliadipatigenens]